jgi:replication fork protection complex subunit Csm3/Swi3
MADDDFDFGDNFVIPQVHADFTIPPPETNTAIRASSPIQIDEEVVVKRKRKPIVKLHDRFFSTLNSTDSRLLAPEGLPALQSKAPQKLKFKGKGHEVRSICQAFIRRNKIYNDC